MQSVQTYIILEANLGKGLVVPGVTRQHPQTGPALVSSPLSLAVLLLLLRSITKLLHSQQDNNIHAWLPGGTGPS